MRSTCCTRRRPPDRHRVGDHPSRRAAARLDGGKYLTDRSVHDHIYFTFGRSAQPSGLCLRSLVAPLQHVANPVSALEESPKRVALLEQLGDHCALARGVWDNRPQLHSELRQGKACLFSLPHRTSSRCDFRSIGLQFHRMAGRCCSFVLGCLPSSHRRAHPIVTFD